jgi:hypothetical protein
MLIGAAVALQARLATLRNVFAETPLWRPTDDLRLCCRLTTGNANFTI